MPHSVPFETAAKQSSFSADVSSGILSGSATKKASSSANNSSSVVTGRVRKYSSASRHQTTTKGLRVEDYARMAFPAQTTINGWQDEKAQDVMMSDAFSDKAIQEMAVNDLSNSARLCYRKPPPPPAFPFSRQEGWCLRDKLRTYRKWRFNKVSREKDPVDRLIHWHLEKVAEDKRPKRKLSLYLQKLDVILTTTKYLYDSTELCKERAKTLQYEPAKPSPLRECMSIEDESEIAKDIENFFEQWLSRYEDLYQPEEMNWEGVQQVVSTFVEQTMDWESDVPPVGFSGQLSMNRGSVGPLVPPVAPETEYGHGGHLDAMMKDLIIPNLTVPKSSMG